MTKLLSRTDVMQVLSMADTIEILAAAFADLSNDNADMPQRTPITTHDHGGLAIFMPAYLKGMGALGAKVITLSDSSGYIHDPEGISQEKLAFVKRLKNFQRGRIREYAQKYLAAVYTEADYSMEYNPLWSHRADCAFPCATQNEINDNDAYKLINNNIKLICEGANMPCTPAAVDIFQDKHILYRSHRVRPRGQFRENP